MGLSHSPRIVTDGLVFCVDAANKRSYPGAGTTWTDLTANKNNGTLTNGPTFDSANGGGVLLDGTDDYIDFGTIGSSITSYFTWQIVVKPISFSKTLRLMWSRNGGGIWTSLDSNNVYFTLGALTDYSMSGTFEIGKIYVLTYVISNNQWIMYVNGSLLNTITINTSRTQSDNVWRCGVIINNNGTIRSDTYSNQTMYAIAYYNRALSAEEIKQNYLATKGRYT